MLNRIAGWILDLISNDPELNVEPIHHPYYPGEADLTDEERRSAGSDRA